MRRDVTLRQSQMNDDLRIAPAREQDVPLILSLIKALAEYERLAHEVVATESDVRESLFGPRPHAEAVIARVLSGGSGEAAGAEGEGVGFAVWFHTFSTFLSRPGLYLEDLFVLPAWRGRGIGRALMAHLARVAVERGCGRMEWAVLDWNDPAIGFYRSIGARAMDEWTVYRLTGDALKRVAQ
jgi:GNAT superfamily N-acetyltransferase